MELQMVEMMVEMTVVYLVKRLVVLKGEMMVS